MADIDRLKPVDQPRPISVVFQHRNRAFRELLAAYLDREPDITLAGYTAQGSDLVQLCELRQPAVTVYEADAPRWSNDRLITQLRPAGGRIRIIGIHEALPASNIVRAYRAGVDVLVSYGSGLERLIAAIKEPSLVETAKARRGRNALTERELEVLSLLSSGYPNEHAAWLMGVTLNTLEYHKRRVFAKLGVHDQAHAAASAVRLGLSRTPSSRPVDAHPMATGSRSPRVIVTGPAGDAADRIRKILEQSDIPLLEEPVPTAAEPGDVTVMVVDEALSDQWRLPGARGGLVVVVPAEVKLSKIAEAWLRGASIVPAHRIDDLLVTAVQAACQDHLILASSHSRAILSRERPIVRDGSRPLPLTPREREILLHIGHGHAMKQTAHLLGISVRTVENLQSNLFRKLRVHDRTSALSTAYNLGLLDELSEGDPSLPVTT